MKNTKAATIVTGLLALFFGVLIVSVPRLIVGSLILLLSVYLVFLGILKVAEAIKEPQGSSSRLPWLIFGALAIVTGFGLLFYPQISVALFAFLVAFYAIALGVAEFTAGFGNKSTGMKILSIVIGVLSILFGLYLIFNPNIAVALLIMLLGWYQIIYGLYLIIIGIFRKPAIA